ncbi:MAG: STAS domain-containing protein [Planctomycetota bacterium]
MNFEKRVERQESTLIITLMGELTSPETPEFKTWVTRLLDPAPSRVEVRCGDLRFIDSSGLGALLYLYKHVKSRGGQLRLVEVCGWLQKFLRITGLEEKFCEAPISESS